MPVSRKPAERRPARLAPLSRLPVFLNLQGRRVLVAGGSAAAAWKAELLAAAGAEVTVCATSADPAMAALSADGAVSVHARDWAQADLAGCAIAIADLEEADGARFAAAAKAIGVPANVIDQPDLCSFEIGSIVNRSPVVIGISTAGTAPVLGQEIRARIEAMLPAGLAAWAEAAGRIRATVGARLNGLARRTFWRRFARRAFEAVPADPDAVLQQDLTETETPAGRVTLVGAGPGAADLMTLRAVRALQAADVILFDDLVDGSVLELGRREARRIAVGKRGGAASCRQNDIVATMIGLAREGLRVVRLKSGDPMVFGRASEEIDALEAAGIPVDVVPGITAASAAAAGLKRSLTHRDHARTVTCMTGFTRDHAVPDGLDWAALAEPTGTLAIYMGGKVAPRLARRLMLAGRSGDTPVVVAEGISHADERYRSMCLKDLLDYERHTDRPVLLLVGEAMRAAAAPANRLATMPLACTACTA